MSGGKNQRILTNEVGIKVDSIGCRNNVFEPLLMLSQHLKGKKYQYRIKYIQVKEKQLPHTCETIMLLYMIL